MSDERGVDLGSGNLRIRQSLAAVILILFLLPWVGWPLSGGETRPLNGLDSFAASFAGVQQAYDAAAADVAAAIAGVRDSVERAEKRAQETAGEADAARAEAAAAPDDTRLARNLERRTRSAERASEQLESRRRELQTAETKNYHLWLNYLLYLYPAALAVTLLGAVIALAGGFLGGRGRRAGVVAGLAGAGSFLGVHVWFGLPLLDQLSVFAWIGLLACLALVPASLGLLRTATWIDLLNRRLGQSVAWLSLFMVVVQFALVIMRYVFGVGSIMVQESLVYGHGLLFMLAAGYTLLVGGHVRVDIFYREAPPRKKAITDLFGVCLLLIPVCLVIWIYALPYVTSSWAVFEGSRETSGIPAIFLLKTAMPLFVILMILQGIALALRSVLVLQGRLENAGPATGGGH